MDFNGEGFLLAKYDISGIQDYIFATNRLRENAGASYLVNWILNQLLTDTMEQMGKEDRSRQFQTEWKGRTFSREKSPDFAGEVIYIGGGNALVIYQTKAIYDEVSRRMAITAAEHCSGLLVISASVEITWDNLAKDIARLDHKIAEVKKKMQRPFLLSRFPIAEQDSLYGQPVTSLYAHENGSLEYRSEYQRQKQEAFDQLKGQELEFGSRLPEGIGYAVEMEDLCRKKGEDSYIAVVHIDGNGVGEIIKNQLEKPLEYEKAVKEFRELSADLSQLCSSAYLYLQQLLVSNVKELSKARRGGKDILPFRPLITGGDDLTFLCPAYLALPMTGAYLRNLLNLNKGSLQLTACAGIAFVHSHFPFRIAYEIAEECCGNAKKKWYQNKKKNTECYLDFHVVEDVYLSQFSLLRQEETYKNLLTRPYCVDKGDGSGKSGSLESLVRLLDRLKGKEELSAVWPKNRLIRLYHAYLEGKDAVRLLSEEFASRGYFLKELSEETVAEGFTVEGKAPLFDALELMEFYFPKAWDYVRKKQPEGGRA